MTTNALEVAGLAKSFGGHTVLHGVDLTIPEGTVTAVVGASGCGKTTLLRLVAGFETPDAGTISVAGRIVAGPKGVSRRTAATSATSRRTVHCSLI